MWPILRKNHSGPSRRSRLNHLKRGFTLIELLVVVAIIALLVSILLPSLTKARMQAKTAACLANLHDFGSSHHQYAHSNDPFFPLPVYAGSNIGVGINSVVVDDNLFALWQFKFARSVNLWSCPGKAYKVRTPEVVAKVMQNVGAVNTINVTGGTTSLPQKNFIRYDITTAGDNTRSDFREIGQKDASGYGSSYEYAGWSICSKLKGTHTVNNWHPSHYGSSHWGTPKTTRIGQPTPQHAMMMHDADDDGAVAAPGGISANNTPEPWDNHGVNLMNMLFADGHSSTIRNFEITPGYTKLSQIWKRNDCNQSQLGAIQPW